MATAQLGTLLRHIHKLAVTPEARQGTDRQLLDDFAVRRDEAAFAALVVRHGPMVLRVCRRVLHHEQDAEDAFQATFLVLARHTGSIRKREALASWLYGVAQRTAMKARRTAARRRNHEADLRDFTPSTTASPSWDEVQAVLDEEIQRLPDTYRAAFVLCVLEGKSASQAAAELGVKEGTVWSRLARARQLLQQRLTRRGIKLAGVLAALAVVGGRTRAGVPALLANLTIRSGLLVAAGEPAAGVIPTHVAALAPGVTRAMFLTKVKMATAVLLAAALAAGAAALMQRVTAADEPAKPPAAATANPSGEEAKQPAAPTGEEKGKTVEVRGRVLDPDGKPFPGADVHLVAQSHVMGKFRHAEAKSGADGAFRLSAPPRAAQAADGDPFEATRLMATAAGYGLAVGKSDPLGLPEDLTVRLAHDDVPVRGRILDLQGKPLAGVTVRVTRLCAPTAGDLGPWLEALQANPQDGYPIEAQFLEGVSFPDPGGPFPQLVTDAEGRFALKGVGRERVVEILLQGPTVALARVSVRTRPGPMIVATMFARNPEGGKLTYYGATFDHAAAPTRPIVGTVRDKDTGKPLAGITVQSNKFAGVNTSGDSSVRTITDKDGRYRLAGMAKGVGNVIKAAPATGQPYFQALHEVEDSPGLEPVTVDFTLKRGVLVKGRVLDKATGQPVFANVTYVVFADNLRRTAVPGFTTDNYLQTGEDGSFQLVAFPGRGLLTARGWSDHYRMGVGADAIAGKGEHGLFGTEPYLQGSDTFHRYVEINPPEGAESISCDLLLDPGRMPRGTVVGPDGKALAGARAYGLTAYGQSRNWAHTPLEGADFTVYGLGDGEGREVLFMHAENKLAGALRVRGDDRGPLAAKLEPWGVVTGRLVTAEGKPQAGVLLRIADWLLPNNGFQTDQDGRFRVEGLAPGVAYTLDVVQKGQRAAPVFTGLTAKAGETRDLGDIALTLK
jgi:RNA polymerase sigma factor (sigma-70 family)